ncbi:MAG: hypothetical protein HYX44_11085 [Aquabacterium sp.]|nr:hypothetical protein [Aquabacterium sp.]
MADLAWRMTPEKHIKLVTGVLASSVAIEVNLLAGLERLPDAAYHGLHIALMAAVVLSQFMLYVSSKGRSPYAGYAGWMALGMASTAVGDYVNGAMSGVEPVSLKLTWALLLFGVGYVIYVVMLWRHDREMAAAGQGARGLWRYGLALPVLVGNLLAWIQHVQPGVQAHTLLCYGSFVFNLTIYVAMPVLAMRYFINSQWHVGGLVVLIGGVLIPYSDLILFGSWLRSGVDPAVPSFQLYAYNWIVYFGGQALMAMFPALVMQSEARAKAA